MLRYEWSIVKVRVIVLGLLLCICFQNAQAQHFTLKVDTFWINASDFVTPTCKFEMQRSAKCRDYYFCCFRQNEHNFSSGRNEKNHLIAISLDGKTVKKVPMPNDFDNDYYFNLFSRNDTLYIKPYWELKQTHYRFNYDKWTWETTSLISDVIYEDADYQIVYKDFGEWGSYTWFVDKDSYNQYLFKGHSERIVSHHGSYYCLGQGVQRWDDPTKGLLCVDTLKHNSEKAFGGIAYIQYTEGLNYYQNAKEYKSSIGDAEFVYRIQGRENYDDWWESKIYDTIFKNMISLNDQLYFWTVIKDSTYITTIEDGKLIKVLYIPGDYRFFSWARVDRGSNIAPNKFVNRFKKDSWTSGLVDMVDSTISIHYLIHNQDSLHFLGEDNVEFLVEYLLEHKDNLTLSAVDSLERQLGGTPSTLLKNVYEEENYNPKRQLDEDYMKIRYFKLVDTSLVVETSYYFNRKDSIVNEFKIKLQKPNYFISSSRGWVRVDFKPNVFKYLKDYFTKIVGEKPVSNEYNTAWLWSFGGRTLTLQKDGVGFEK